MSIIPEALLHDRDLSLNAIRLYDLLRRNPSASQSELAAELHMTRNGIYKLERQLIAKRYLRVVNYRDAKGRHTIREFFELEHAG